MLFHINQHVYTCLYTHIHSPQPVWQPVWHLMSPKQPPSPVPCTQVADPEDACAPFTFSNFEDTWVALVSRAQQPRPTNCTFDVKVSGWTGAWGNLQCVRVGLQSTSSCAQQPQPTSCTLHVKVGD
jgi:hypothetical protein